MTLFDRLRAAAAAVRARLVDDWRAVLKRWSVWLTAINAFLTGSAVIFQQQALSVWSSLPADIREHVPGGEMFIPTMLAVSALVAAVIKQGKSNG